jgi:hypothetical protein
LVQMRIWLDWDNLRMHLLCLRSVIRVRGSVLVLVRQERALSSGVSRERRPRAGSVLPERAPWLEYGESFAADVLIETREVASRWKSWLCLLNLSRHAYRAIVERERRWGLDEVSQIRTLAHIVSHFSLHTFFSLFSHPFASSLN